MSDSNKTCSLVVKGVTQEYQPGQSVCIDGICNTCGTDGKWKASDSKCEPEHENGTPCTPD